MKEEITALENKIRVMQNAFENARANPTTPSRLGVQLAAQNGYSSPRISSYDRSRSVTPNGKPRYESIHAPKATKTNGVLPSSQAPRYPAALSRASTAARQSYIRAQAPSPTPSTVSAAPTVDADGWYSFE